MTEPPVSLTPAPAGYADWLAELKTRIHTAQQRAALAVNRELVLLYWHHCWPQWRRQDDVCSRVFAP